MAYAFNNDRSKNDLSDVVRTSDITDVVRTSDITDVLRTSRFLLLEFEKDLPGPRWRGNFSINVTSYISNPDDWLFLQMTGIGLGSGGGSAAWSANANRWRYADTYHGTTTINNYSVSLSPILLQPYVHRFYKLNGVVYVEGEIYFPWDFGGYMKIRLLFMNINNSCTKYTMARNPGTWTSK